MIVGRRGIGDVASHSAGGYVPNCAGTYDPTVEVDKAYAAGITPGASLLAKAQLWVQTCGNRQEAPAAPAYKAGVVATSIASLMFQPPGPGPARRDQPAGASTQPPPLTTQPGSDIPGAACPEGYYSHTPCSGGEATCVPNGVSTPACMEVAPPATASWLSENKGAVGLGLVALVGVIILVKAL